MKNIKLRNEKPSDYRSVEELTREAFWNHHVPGYYSKFGFVEAENYDIRTSDNMYAVPLQALELYQGALLNCAGCFVEGSVYDIDETAANEFDKDFPEKDKQSGLPSQELFIQLVNMRKPRICQRT